VPTTALVASCADHGRLHGLPFSKLVVIDILLYAAALSLEFVALIALRLSRADLPRPSGSPAASRARVLVLVLPMTLAGIVVYQSLVGEERGGSHNLRWPWR
jgi:amino acid transporter